MLGVAEVQNSCGAARPQEMRVKQSAHSIRQTNSTRSQPRFSRDLDAACRYGAVGKQTSTGHIPVAPVPRRVSLSLSRPDVCRRVLCAETRGDGDREEERAVGARVQAR
eukprot:1202183-Rhodomonas_salina.1